MSMLATLGGAFGGLGSSGGVGGSVPSNSSSASSAANVSINPSIAAGKVGAESFAMGPFSVAFPGASITPSDSINAPAFFSGKPGTMLALGGLAILAIGFLIWKLR